MTKAYILINTDVSSETEVLEELQNYDEIISAHLVYGVYDIIAVIESDDFDEIKEGLLNEIRTLDKIRSTVTMIVAKEA